MQMIGLRFTASRFIVAALILTGIAAILSGIDLITGDWMGVPIQPEL
jgi:hypothetical protein